MGDAVLRFRKLRGSSKDLPCKIPWSKLRWVKTVRFRSIKQFSIQTTKLERATPGSKDKDEDQSASAQQQHQLPQQQQQQQQPQQHQSHIFMQQQQQQQRPPASMAESYYNGTDQKSWIQSNAILLILFCFSSNGSPISRSEQAKLKVNKFCHSLSLSLPLQSLLTICSCDFTLFLSFSFPVIYWYRNFWSFSEIRAWVLRGSWSNVSGMN